MDKTAPKHLGHVVYIFDYGFTSHQNYPEGLACAITFVTRKVPVGLDGSSGLHYGLEGEDAPLCPCQLYPRPAEWAEGDYRQRRHSEPGGVPTGPRAGPPQAFGVGQAPVAAGARDTADRPVAWGSEGGEGVGRVLPGSPERPEQFGSVTDRILNMYLDGTLVQAPTDLGPFYIDPKHF